MDENSSLIETEKRPVVEISKADIEAAQNFIKTHPPKQQQKRVTFKSSACPKRFKHTHQEINNQPRKCCFVCGFPSSVNTKISQSRFELYSRLVEVLEFNHGLPNGDHMEEQSQFCCSTCFKAVETLWDYHQQITTIKSHMSEIIKKIRLAIRHKTAVHLDAKNKTHSSGGIWKSGERKKNEKRVIRERSHSHLSNTKRVRKGREESPKVNSEIGEEPEELNPLIKCEIEEDVDVDFDNLDFDSFIVPSPTFIHGHSQDFNDEEFQETSISSRPTRKSKSKATLLIKKVSHFSNKIEKDFLEDTEDFEPLHQVDDPQYSPVVSDGEKDEGDYLAPQDEDNDDDDWNLEDNDSDYGGKRGKSSKGKSRPKSRFSESDMSKPFRCEICGQRFVHANSMFHHNEEFHLNVRKYYCPTCEFGFYRKGDMERHLLNHSPSKPFYCKECGKSFPAQETLQFHLASSCKSLKGGRTNSAIVQTELRCPTCCEIFESLGTLKKHISDLHKERILKPYECEFCPVSCSSRGSLAHHIKCIHHKIRNHACHICGKGFYRKGDMEKHLNSHTPSKPFHCTQCGKSFCEEESLLSHQSRSCGTIQTPKLREIVIRPPREKPTTTPRKNEGNYCELCNEKFGSLYKLEIHVKESHPGHRPFKCSICQMAFTRNKVLQRHVQFVHQKEGRLNKYKCTICGYGFVFRRARDEHTSSHKEECPFHCDKCGLSFTDEASLSTHQAHYCKSLKQNKPEPYCRTCEKNLPSFTKLYEHLEEVHGIKKAFKCDFESCSISCSTPKALFRHKQCVHEKIKPFSCTICPQSFYKKGDLNKHERRHRGEKSYKCGQCHKSYVSKDQLRQHETSSARCGKDDEAKQLLREKRRGIYEAYKKTDLCCHICGKRFLKESSLDFHFKSSHPGEPTAPPEGENPVKPPMYKKLDALKFEKTLCYICGKSMINASLRNHLRFVHERQRNYKCDKCPKAFASATRLRLHMRNHEDHPPGFKLCDGAGQFPCHICGLVLKYSKGLKDHIRGVHEKKRPHKCDFEGCTFSAYRKYDVYKHSAIHGGEKRFPCGKCRRRFGERSELERHRAEGCKKSGRARRKREERDTSEEDSDSSGNEQDESEVEVDSIAPYGQHVVQVQESHSSSAEIARALFNMASDIPHNYPNYHQWS